MTNCQKNKAILKTEKKKAHAARALGFREGALTIIAIFFMLLILKNSDVAIDYMSQGIKLCARTVIPSLFPFMVISDILVGLRLGSLIEKILPEKAHKLLGITPKELCVFLLGAFCGFPVGAKVAGGMYARGELSAAELERVLTFSNNPSSAFLISAVGASLYGEKRVGALIYCALIISSLVSMQLWRFSENKSEKNDFYLSPSAAEGSARFDLTGAIGRSIGAILNVCAYVMFFSTVCGIMRVTFFSSQSKLLGAIIGGFFEMSSGISQASAIEPTMLSVILSAMIGSWSGLSVHLQVISAVEAETHGLSHISLKPYILHKIFQCALTGAICYAVLKFTDLCPLP